MQRFTEISSYQKDVYFTALLSTAFATIFLIAPTSQHRLPWRRHARAQRLQLAHLLIIMGLLFLAVGMSFGNTIRLPICRSVWKKLWSGLR
jgi:integral membrane sensor domain MASE1